MGFYTKGYFLQLPYKRVIDDVLEREGSATDESFTPFEGVHHIISEQMIGTRFSVLNDLTTVLRYVNEFQITRVKGNSDEDSLGDLESSNPTAARLEDVDQKTIENFVRSQLIGLKVNKTGARSIVNEASSIQPGLVDEESGAIINFSDIKIVEDDCDITHEEEQEAKDKIPYLLKKLQDGSIEYGISLLSMFIARDAIIRNKKSLDYEIKPRDLLQFDIYNVSKDGILTNTVDPATANNTSKFRIAKDVVIGVDKMNPYYRAGMELIRNCYILQCRLADEDVTDYTPQYINRLTCRYVMSNIEVYSDIACFDNKIMEILKSGGIFLPPCSETIITRKKPTYSGLRIMARQKADKIPIMIDKLRVCHNELSLYNPINLIDRFLILYKKINEKSKIEECRVSDCNSTLGVLCDSEEQPLIFNCKYIVPMCSPTPGYPSPFFILTIDGYLVLLDDSSNTITYTSVSEALNFYETKDYSLISLNEVRL